MRTSPVAFFARYRWWAREHRQPGPPYGAYQDHTGCRTGRSVAHSMPPLAHSMAADCAHNPPLLANRERRGYDPAPQQASGLAGWVNHRAHTRSACRTTPMTTPHLPDTPASPGAPDSGAQVPQDRNNEP